MSLKETSEVGLRPFLCYYAFQLLSEWIFQFRGKNHQPISVYLFHLLFYFIHFYLFIYLFLFHILNHPSTMPIWELVFLRWYSLKQMVDSFIFPRERRGLALVFKFEVSWFFWIESIY